MISVVENRAFGISLGAFDYLVKPVDRAALFLTLSRAGVLASRGHVLVVDDDADVRALFEHELVAAGYRVRTAEGVSAQRLFAVGMQLRIAERLQDCPAAARQYAGSHGSPSSRG